MDIKVPTNTIACSTPSGWAYVVTWTKGALDKPREIEVRKRSPEQINRKGFNYKGKAK
jgi:hypothetical protein